MSEPLDRNAKVIAEFRADEGRVGGVFEGAPLVLVHHCGRKSGQQQVSPARRYPRFAEYARQTVGIRTTPVFELRQA
ncbi:nitroreductase/quinone reductase family protein [Streptomyces lavendulae]|uniref:nitroreductase/quinone reductase family protein n=1 Tax=Streptomyces lavendulae TaxID=1914 RepID=UPI0036ECC973